MSDVDAVEFFLRQKMQALKLQRYHTQKKLDGSTDPTQTAVCLGILTGLDESLKQMEKILVNVVLVADRANGVEKTPQPLLKIVS